MSAAAAQGEFRGEVSSEERELSLQETQMVMLPDAVQGCNTTMLVEEAIQHARLSYIVYH